MNIHVYKHIHIFTKTKYLECSKQHYSDNTDYSDNIGQSHKHNIKKQKKNTKKNIVLFHLCKVQTQTELSHDVRG